MLSGVMMLRHIGENKAASKLETAISESLADPSSRTKDLGGDAGTAEFTGSVIARL
jgi:isocitrate dehydrogenase (NAD+)